MVRKTGTNLCIDIHCISKVQIYILILILEAKNKILKIGKMRKWHQRRQKSRNIVPIYNIWITISKKRIKIKEKIGIQKNADY